LISATQHILDIERLQARYGNTAVLSEVTLSLIRGEICSIVGEEGAGKSTLLKAITRQIATCGTIAFKNRSLQDVPTERMVANGLDFVEQGGNILKNFTVQEHICLALSENKQMNESIFWKEAEKMFPKMASLKKQPGGRLSGGERMLCSILCVMATDSDLIILDEPTAGLAPAACDTIKKLLFDLKNRGKTILVMEHNHEFATEISDSVAVISNGTLSKKYNPEEFRNPGFIGQYLYEKPK
jgi:branched-chain amino acid transport system ATP-binding protein